MIPIAMASRERDRECRPRPVLMSVAVAFGGRVPHSRRDSCQLDGDGTWRLSIRGLLEARASVTASFLRGGDLSRPGLLALLIGRDHERERSGNWTCCCRCSQPSPISSRSTQPRPGLLQVWDQETSTESATVCVRRGTTPRESCARSFCDFSSLAAVTTSVTREGTEAQRCRGDRHTGP